MLSKKYVLLLTALPLLFSLNVLVLALPGVPHQFYGSVSINGNPAPDDSFCEN